MFTKTRYILEWEYEQKEGFHKAENMTEDTLGELLRFLVSDDESNRTYVRVFQGHVGEPVWYRVPLEGIAEKLNYGSYRYLVDGTKD